MKSKKLHHFLQYGALYLFFHLFLFAYLQVACQSENALQTVPSVRVAITASEEDVLQVALLQNTYTLPIQSRESNQPIPVYADNLSCFLYFLWDNLLSGKS